VLAALATLLVACTGSSPQTPHAPTLADAKHLLATYAGAILNHSEQHLLDDIDPQSSEFRTQQRTDYASLARIPLRLWHYAIVGVIHDPAANHAAARRYGAPVLLVHVTLLYALRDVDPIPSRHDQYLVFTMRNGHTYLAGDDALTGETIVSWVGPWRYGPLVAVSGARSLVLGPPGDDAVLQRLASEIDAGIASVSAVWGTGWSQRVAAIVPADAATFTALTGAGSRESSAAAVTGGIDSLSGRPYGQRLVINPAPFAALSPLGRRIVITHEITHLASAAATADITPRWLVEGFAEYVANLHTGQPVAVAASELRAELAHGRVPTHLPDDTGFASSGTVLAAQYEQAWLACRLIAARVGQSGLVRFYRAVGTALAPRAEAVAGAFRTVLHEPQAAFVQQWRTYLRTSLR
jgi:hypothetical protein